MRAARPAVMGAVALTGALLLSGCGSDDSSDAAAPTGGGSAPAGGSGEPVAAVIKGLDNPFFQTMQEGIESQASTSGTTVQVQAAQAITDTTGQADRLSALAQQSYGCFIVNPITGNNLVQGLAQIAARGIPVVNIDQPVDAEAAEAAGLETATYIGTNNVNAGKLAGEQMVEAVGSGKVAVIGGLAGDVTSAARIEGFTQAIGTTLTALPVQAADWERQKALTIATDLLTANPDLKGIFAANDDMGLGAAQAVANAGKAGQVSVISVDGNKDALEAVQAGTLTATVAQYPYAIGSLGVQACVAAEQGKDLPENIESPVALVTKDVAADAIATFPQPFEEFDNPLADLAG
ncbi:sugar ABC transporter substrate-binding protein [Motilibacter aurantiacus]|uniref:sugar ABC transporter substrate-binding protein n=1 Tax=Motilibacter aurantiacus TaxID=2714955 RepID=UPI00140DB366|nr:substrate-binding domain-containing protein [Motilibacter aurantiacus]NHC44173.1 sugar ABC transporter substrate-binding protein [Motilibacter aurantiacus]